MGLDIDSGYDRWLQNSLDYEEYAGFNEDDDNN